MFKVLKLNVSISKLNKVRQAKQTQFRTNSLLKRAYKDLKTNWKEMQRIKKDRFLRQALIDGDEFFEIQVCTMQTGLSELVFTKNGAAAT
jgi:hypothetical protein